MKHTLIKTSVLMCLAAFVAACGGGGSSEIDGPTLSMSEAGMMVVDQLYINGGMDDEYSSEGEFSVYLRDAATGEDIACTTADGGMDKLSTGGFYYGGLDIPIQEVSTEHPSESARFQVVFVEQDSKGCPDGIDEEDDIAGTSEEFMFENLLGKQIWATNGRAAVVFRNQNEEAKNIKAMAPALSKGLAIDELYFENGSDGDVASRYYVFVDRVEDGKSVYQCQLDDALLANIRYGNIVYAALGFPISCFDPDDPDFDEIPMRLGVYIQKESGTELVAETEPAPIGELVGEVAYFKNQKGYVSFQGVMDTPFTASVLRLDELISLEATYLQYALTPSFRPTVELEITDSGGSYVIACSGSDQGLTGVGAPGTYDNLSAAFVAADGQRELFGWSGVLIRLVDRADGLKCPSPLAAKPTVLATSGVLSTAKVSAGNVDFDSGAGKVKYRIVVE